MVDINPEGNIFGIFRNLNYKPWYAIAEFVDNSVSAWANWDSPINGVARPDKVKVHIEVGGSDAEPFIEIRDNASGIKLEDFPIAFKVASIPVNRKTGLNEFGMGMKTAGFWFSNSWSVNTAHAGEGISRAMHFDLEKILNERIRDIEPIERKTSATSHFTTVHLGKLNQVPKGRTVGRIKDHLASMYRCFLRSGDLELVYNGERLSYSEPEVLVAKKAMDPEGLPITWRKEFSFELSSGRKVNGFAGLLNTGSTSFAGFSIFRNNRLIEGSGDETYRPQEIFGSSNSFVYQRLFGELHLHGFKSSHMKDQIQWQDNDEEELVATLKAVLTSGEVNLLWQAEKYRKNQQIPLKTVESVLSEVKSGLEISLPDAINSLVPRLIDVEVSIPESIEPLEIAVASTSLRIDTHNHGIWQVEISALNDESISSFIEVGSTVEHLPIEGADRQSKINVRLNLGHPFCIQYLGANQQGLELLFAYSACLAIALSVGRTIGAKSNYIVQYINDILRFKGEIQNG